MLKRLLCVSLLIWSSSYASAQLKLYPLESQKISPNVQYNSEIAKAQTDTLTLPFFEDFSTDLIYPNALRWTDKDVYVNTSFGYRPPSIGVATFDALDETGKPYDGTINSSAYIFADYLTSSPIRLLNKQNKPYTAKDSLYLSFYYQANGYGYELDKDDSLGVQFLNSSGDWINIWSQNGDSKTTPFQQVFIPVQDSVFLHGAFQFRFYNYTRQSGNANHWNVDYILLDSGRSMLDSFHRDYAIQQRPTSLLKRYYSMPYNQYLANAGNETADSIFLRVSNVDKVVKNIEIRHIETVLGQTLVSSNYTDNANNVLANDDALRRFKNFNFTNLSGDTVRIKRRYEIQEPSLLNAFRDNDAVEVEQFFGPYFAYDDGSAESGFGFDNDATPSNIPGQVALEYNLNVTDTLKAIGVFFNQSVLNVTSRALTLKIWKTITAVGSGTAGDEVIWEKDILILPTDTGFYHSFNYYMLDTTLVLTPGKFYIGWSQNSMFNANIGWDKNHGYHASPETPSPYLYYEVLGNWSSSNLPGGALMMRPYFGPVPENHVVSVGPKKSIEHISVYPNPTRGWIEVKGIEQNATLSVVSISGSLVVEKVAGNKIDCSALPPGTYVLRIEQKSKPIIHQKIIKY